jgi:6-phospho-3-hexuloisomerase
MSFVKDTSIWILSGIKYIIEGMKDSQINKMVEMILGSQENKILLLGAGRSGFVGRAFALRLMHLGFRVYVSGETISPVIVPNDLVIGISGSGRTRVVVTQAEVSKSIGAKVIAITSNADSPLALLSDQVVEIKGRTKDDPDIDYTRRQITGEFEMAPLGTMFELSSAIFLDSVIAELMKMMGESEVDLRIRHANVE